MQSNLDGFVPTTLNDSERLRLIEENVRDYAIITLDPQGRITAWNWGAEAILGWQTHEIVGRSGAVIFTPEDRDNGVATQELETAQTQGRSEDKRWHVRKDGTRFWASGVMTSLREASGELRGFVKILRDATQRHQAKVEKETLLQSTEDARARLASLFMQAPAFIAVLRGPCHIFEMANPMYLQLVGHRAVLGKTVQEALPEVEEQGFLTLLDDVYHTGKPFIGKNMSILLQAEAHGPLQERFIDFVYQPLMEADGAVSGIFVHGVDFTEYRQALTEIENLNLRLRRSVQETHHRVKNNLQVISALADLQMEGNTVPVAALARIGQHARSLAALHDLLTHEAKTDIETQHISVSALMEKLIPLLQATTGGRMLNYTVENFRLPVREGTSLALLVSELVSNAVKHGRNDIEVNLSVEEDSARLQVGDDGPGFPSGFDWRQAANTGLGLIDSTGRHDLQGTITYENRLQGGAQVVVVFPVAQLPPMNESA